MSKEEILKNINQNDGSQDNRIIIFCVCYFTLGKKKPFFLILCAEGVLSACMPVYHLCVNCPRRPERGIRVPETGDKMVVNCHVSVGN